MCKWRTKLRPTSLATTRFRLEKLRIATNGNGRGNETAPQVVYRAHSVTITLLSLLQIRSWFYARRHDSAPVNGLTGQMPFSLPHANLMEQAPNKLPQKLPMPKYTRQREIEKRSGVIYMHQPMLPAKFYCFKVAKTNSAISIERVKNATAVFTSCPA